MADPRYSDPQFRRWVALNDPLMMRRVRTTEDCDSLLREKQELDQKYQK